MAGWRRPRKQQQQPPDHPAVPELPQRAAAATHNTFETVLWSLREKGIKDVAAIQLADGQQVQRRRRTSPPTRRAPPDADRYRHAGTPGKIARSSSHCSAARRIAAALVRDAGNHFRKCQAHGERRQQKHKPGQGARDPDVEQHALGIDRRPHADERAERAQQRRGHKVRQAGVHAVVHGGQVMPELVRQQDGRAASAKTAGPASRTAGCRQKVDTTRSCRPRRTADCGRNPPAWPRPTMVVVSSVSGKQQRHEASTARGCGCAARRRARPHRFRRRKGTAQERNPGRTR